jgi:hypothetical protein
MDQSLINEWLETALPCFPKSLEVIQFLACNVLNTTEILDNEDVLEYISPIQSIPNLREIDITFRVVSG